MASSTSATTSVLLSGTPGMPNYELGNLTGLWTDYEDLPLLVQDVEGRSFNHSALACEHLGLLPHDLVNLTAGNGYSTKHNESAVIDPNLIFGRRGSNSLPSPSVSTDTEVKATLVTPQGGEGSLATIIVRSNSTSPRFNLYFDDAPLEFCSLDDFQGLEHGLHALYFTVPMQNDPQHNVVSIHLEILNELDEVLAKKMVATFEYQQTEQSDQTTSSNSFNEAYSSGSDSLEFSGSAMVRSDTNHDLLEEQRPFEASDYLPLSWNSSHLPESSYLAGYPHERSEVPIAGEYNTESMFDDGSALATMPAADQNPFVASFPEAMFGYRQMHDLCPPPEEFVVRIDNRAVLNMPQNLNEACLGWDEREWECKRRLVQFYRHQTSNVIHAAFKAVAPEMIQPKTIVISCIWWEEREECFVTSVDTIKLLEALVGIQFNVEEKNRIRRNLEGFAPETIRAREGHTGRAKSGEDFFKLIMGYKKPKPRHIEKDIKVFPWRVLGPALKKIIGKYSATFVGPASQPHA